MAKISRDIAGVVVLIDGLAGQVRHGQTVCGVVVLLWSTVGNSVPIDRVSADRNRTKMALRMDAALMT